MKKLKQILLRGLPVLIAALIAYFSYAEIVFQRQEAAYRELREAGWTLYLPHQAGDSYVSCGSGKIIVDRSQKIWVAGQCALDGIQVFDGTQWTTYSSQNSALSSRTFTQLALDTSGKLWTVDDNSVVFFDGENWKSSLQLESCLDGNIQSLVADSHGSIWIFGYNGCPNIHVARSQVRMLRDGGWTTYTPGDAGLPDEAYDLDGRFYGWEGSIGLDAQGEVLLMTSSGAFEFDSKAWLPSKKIEISDQLAIDNRGRQWTWNSDEVRVLEEGGWITLTPENSGLAGTGIYGFAADESNRIWIGNREGISMFAGGDINPVPQEIVDQRRASLAWRTAINGYSWFLPSIFAALWLAAYLDVLPGVLLALAAGVLISLPFGPPIGEYNGLTINPGVAAACLGTAGGVLGGVLGRVLDKRRSRGARLKLGIGLSIVGLVVGFGCAFLLLLVHSY